MVGNLSARKLLIDERVKLSSQRISQPIYSTARILSANKSVRVETKCPNVRMFPLGNQHNQHSLGIGRARYVSKMPDANFRSNSAPRKIRKIQGRTTIIS